jgi:glucose-1-phosphate adenylyltransferase
MDIRQMVRFHREREADATVSALPVPIRQASAFGVMDTNTRGLIQAFQEKPASPPPMPGNPELAFASMGNYLFNTDTLLEGLETCKQHGETDFGQHVLPRLMRSHNLYAYDFASNRIPGIKPHEDPNYWRDVGTIDAYWEANMELIGISPELNLYDREWPIWTYQDQVPPAKFVFDDEGRRGMAVDSMVAGGCIVSGSYVRRSLLFSNVHVHSYSHIEDSVIFPDVDVGRRCVIKKAVIDKGCRIPPDTSIGVDPEQDAARFHVSKGGVVLVTPEMLGQRLHYAR